MNARHFALIAGIVYVLIGVLGFVPAALAPGRAAPDLAVQTGYGYLLGLFPVNILHTVVHLAVGVWGLVAYTSLRAARRYAASLAVIFGVLTIMGLIPVLDVAFGLLPLFGHDVWLHGLTAIAGGYFGFRAGGMVAWREERRRAA